MCKVIYNKGIFICTGVEVDEEHAAVKFMTYGELGCVVLLNSGLKEVYVFFDEMKALFVQEKDIALTEIHKKGYCVR